MKRAQKQKDRTRTARNRPMAEGMMELRQGSRTTPVASGTTYDRNKDRKHRNRGYGYGEY